MPSSRFSGPAPIQQPPPVCHASSPRCYPPPIAGTTVWIDAIWRGLDHLGAWRNFRHGIPLAPQIPSAVFTGNTPPNPDVTFYCELLEIDADQYQITLRWIVSPGPDTLQAQNTFPFDPNSPIPQPLFVLESTEPPGQFATAFIYTT